MDPSIESNCETEREPRNYPFLEKLGDDYPDLAKRLKKQIPEWTKKVDKLSEVSGLGNEILKIMDYISKKDEGVYFKAVSDEVQGILKTTERDKVVFVSWLKGKSAGYIFENIKELFPEELKGRIEIVSSCNLNIENNKIRSGSDNLHFFICDDSANSGKQLEDLIRPFRTNAKHNRKKGFFDRHSKEVNLHVRMMRMTDISRNLVDKLEKDVKNSHVHVDNQSPRMPQGVDAILNMGIDPEQLNVWAQDAILLDHGQWVGSTLGAFFHKLQDNLPPVILKGRRSRELDCPFLLSLEDIPKKYEPISL